MARKKRSTWGSKRRIGPESWELRWAVNGKKDRETFHGTEKEADDRMAVLRVKHMRVKDGSIALNEFFYGVLVPECEERVEDGSFAQQTLDDYRSKYETYISKPFGSRRLDSLRAHEVQAWLSEMTHGAAIQAKRLLKLIMRRAEDLDYIEYHPMNKRYILPTAKAPHARTDERYSEGELIQIFNECRDEWWAPGYIMAAFGGGLPSEVAGVKPELVRFDKTPKGMFCVVPIRYTVHDKRGGDVIISDRAKNELRGTELIVHPPYAGALRAHVRRAIADGDEWLLDDGFGLPVKPSVLSAAFKAWVSKRPIRFIPFGNLRNAYSTMMHAHGLTDDTVQKLMRHSVKSNTDYEHYNRPEAEEFEQMIAEAFGSFIDDED